MKTILITSVLVVVLLLCANACNSELENATPKVGEKKLNHATSIYEVSFDGVKYIVVETHRGIGICRKYSDDWAGIDGPDANPLPPEPVTGR